MSQTKRLLFVDDQVETVIRYIETVREAGYEVVVCNGPLEARRRYNAEQFDLIILDRKMPLTALLGGDDSQESVTTGEQMYQAFPRHLISAPVIFLTNWPDVPTIIHVGGKVSILPKIGPPADLIREIQRLIREYPIEDVRPVLDLDEPADFVPYHVNDTRTGRDERVYFAPTMVHQISRWPDIDQWVLGNYFTAKSHDFSSYFTLFEMRLYSDEQADPLGIYATGTDCQQWNHYAVFEVAPQYQLRHTNPTRLFHGIGRAMLARFCFQFIQENRDTTAVVIGANRSAQSGGFTIPDAGLNFLYREGFRYVNNEQSELVLSIAEAKDLLRKVTRGFLDI